jgi:hypothetical protein
MIDCDILIAGSGIAEAAQVEWAGDESGRLGEFIWRLRSSAPLTPAVRGTEKLREIRKKCSGTSPVVRRAAVRAVRMA